MAKLNFIQNGKANIPELRETLQLSEFHKELEGNYVEIWLNPSSQWLNEFKISTPEQQPQFMSKLWNCSEEEARALIESGELGVWLVDRSFEIIGKYREIRRKNVSSGS